MRMRQSEGWAVVLAVLVVSGLLLFVLGFLTQGFGGVCVINDGAPTCAIIDKLLGIEY